MRMRGELEPEPTLLYNGYERFVADLYNPETLTYFS